MSDPQTNPINIRPGLIADINQITEIYNHYITKTHFTFDTKPFTTQQRIENWFTQFSPTGRYQVFVATTSDEILGYATSTKFKPKPAYETSVDFTVYLTPNNPKTHHQGIGTKLYQTLINALQNADVHRAYAGVALPNDPSLQFHKKMGFTEIGTYREVGRKFNQYHDVTWLERPI